MKSESTASPARSGIYAMVNDVASEWLIAWHTSLRAKGCTLPICIIPFDDRTGNVSRIADRLAIEIWNDHTLQALDEIGRRFYPDDRVSQHLFRRLACFWGPFDQFIFSDIDLIALMNWDQVLHTFVTSDSVFWYFGLSPGQAYKPGAFLDALRAKNRGVCFNSGFFISRRSVLTLEQIQTLVPHALELRAQFVEATGEQPFLNFCLDTLEIPIESASAHLPDLYDWNWALSTYLGRSDFYEIADREGNFQGKYFPLIHWAGFDLCSYMPNRELFLKYRLLHAPLSDKLKYALSWRVRPIFGNAKRAIQRNYLRDSVIGI